MIRLMDIILSLVGLVLLAPLMCLIYIVVLLDSGAPLFSQERAGMHQKKFTLYKFRTMKREANLLPTHLVDKSFITKVGRFLRKVKLDELPQLWNVLKGDMSLVGPRPGLLNHHELIAARNRYGIFDVRPGITGLAQVRGIDMSTPELLAVTDAKMVKGLNLFLYFKFIWITILGKGRGDAVG